MGAYVITKRLLVFCFVCVEVLSHCTMNVLFLHHGLFGLVLGTMTHGPLTDLSNMHAVDFHLIILQE